jgi:hypothetical protein
MSKVGLVAARLFGKGLPRFDDQAEAERVLFARRDELLRMLASVSRHSVDFTYDLSPESLKGLERWYFQLAAGPGVRSIKTDPETFERAIAMYLGAVFVRNATPAFVWIVAEFPFEKGRYEIGVQRELFALMLSRHSFPTQDNKRQESLWRMYVRHASQSDPKP